MDKPYVLISMCSLGIPCQYRPRSFRRAKVDELAERYHLIPVCPEQLGGLPTPRSPCRLLNGRVFGRDGLEYTTEYQRGAEIVRRIAEMYGVRKAYMKNKSPSCGPGGITRLILEQAGITVYLI